jgi:hypothetical protein
MEERWAGAGPAAVPSGRAAATERDRAAKAGTRETKKGRKMTGSL